MRVRHADPERDGAACAATYAPYVDGSGVWFEDVAPTAQEMAARIAIAGIALPDEASIAWQRALGFEEVGTYRDIGWRAGAWRDASWWQLQLTSEDGGEASPPEPLGPQRL